MRSILLVLLCVVAAAVAVRNLMTISEEAKPVRSAVGFIVLAFVTSLVWLVTFALQWSVPELFTPGWSRWLLGSVGAGPFLLVALWVAFLAPMDRLRDIGPHWDTPHMFVPESLHRPVLVVATLEMAALFGAVFVV